MRSDDELSTYVENAEDLVWSVDLDFGLISFNRAAQDRFELNPGVQAEAGLRPLDILPVEQAALWHSLYRRTIEEGPFHVEYEIATGRFLEISFTQLLVDNRVAGVSAVGKDVTEHKAAAKALLEAEKRYHAIFDGALEGIFQTSLDGKLLSGNPALARIFGCDSVEDMYASVSDLAQQAWVVPEERAAFMRKLESEGAVRAYECRLKTKAGTPIWISLNCRRVPASHEVPAYNEGFLEDITERKRAARLALERESRLRRIFDQNGSIMMLLEPESGTIVDANPAAAAYYGYAQKQLIGMNISQIDTMTLEQIAQERATAAQEHRSHFNVFHRLASGEMRAVEVYSSPIDVDGRLIHFSIVRDETERKDAERQLRDSEVRYRTAFQTTLDGISITTLEDGRYIDVNQAFLRTFGFEREEVIDRTTQELDVWADAYERRKMVDALRIETSYQNREVQLRRKNKEEFWVVVSAARIELEGEACILFVVRDISESKAAAEKIEKLAFFDPLTQLPNRRLLLDRLGQALTSSARNGRKRALLFVDLDNFKTVNDILGHRTGDLLLQEAARRMTRCIRKADTVARLGGDEFVVMLEDLGSSPEEAATHARIVGEKILAALQLPYMLAGRECRSDSSIGITIFEDGALTTDEILRQADIAMYQAKTAGRGNLRFFAPSLQAAVSARAAMEEDLRLALTEEQFLLYYQPQVHHGRLTGSEALVRWKHPKRGILAPGEFISLAEDTGQILTLGNWVLETACAQIAAWGRQKTSEHLTLSVNISARQFRQPDFCKQVLSVIDSSGANPLNLKLELTESLLVENIEDVIAKMAELRWHGVQFALDDFGTGYSSLSYLKRLPLEQLKIDRSFINDILFDVASGAIVQTIISLGRAMGLTVMAEGVETEDQREFLAHLGCHSFQGYLVSRPVPLEEFHHMWPEFTPHLKG